ncbi:MAG: type VI secretion system baseplate subunit TssG [Pseudomonadota bacterium]
MSDDPKRGSPGGAPGAEETELVFPFQLQGREHVSAMQLINLIDRMTEEDVFGSHGRDASREPVRFRTTNSLSFPAGEIAGFEARRIDLEDAESRWRYDVTVTFLGLLGSVSPLPPYYLESIKVDEDSSDEDRALSDFLNLFNHRLITLFYEVWRKYRYHLIYKPGAKDRFSHRLFNLLGLETGDFSDPRPWHQAEIDWIRLLPFAGLLSQYCRSASTLETIVSAYFDGVPVRIEECCLRRISVRDEQRNRLGQANARLGQDMVLGKRVYDISGKFRAHIGPVDVESFRRLLPEGEQHRTLSALLAVLPRRVLLEFDIALSLDPAIGRAWRLGADQPGLDRLGWSTWLGQGQEGRPDPGPFLTILTPRDARLGNHSAAEG